MARNHGPIAGSHGTVGAIVVAAGASRRMGGIDKIFAPLDGLPLIAHSLHVLNSLDCVKQIVLVLSEGNLDRGGELIASESMTKVTHVCEGGSRRQDSVLIGLNRLDGFDWVAVHDGARPLLTDDIVLRGLKSVVETGATTAAVRVKDTIKIVEEDGTVTSTPARDRLWAVQTPQIFAHDLLRNAHDRVKTGVTDDASMVEMIGGKVKVFEGSYENIKVTTPEDLILAESLLKQRPARTHGASS
ncbi:MAG: 2-C-methyl-D-erythritol 4-phosphate cytidylyltransferase [Chloroflexi bacterium]|nr:2-C-methyl-D-erythritol 4-phosphate cytidylyltransferase [Chloroflexota bacterium]